jgi:hypothetical protein
MRTVTDRLPIGSVLEMPETTLPVDKQRHAVIDVPESQCSWGKSDALFLRRELHALGATMAT